jgi:Domain of unknown function (DUF4261)
MDDTQPTEQRPIRPMAVAMFERPYEPNQQALVAAIRSRHPDLPVEVCNPHATEGETAMQAPLIRCGGEIVTLLSLPGPVLPHSENPIWIRASGVWPQARAAGVRHRGHVFISSIGTRSLRLRTAKILTAVAGSLIAAAPGSCAVAWDGRTARSAEMWSTLSRSAFAPYPEPGHPFMLWIDIVPFRSDGAFGAVTNGLSAFVGREIEFETDKPNLGHVLTNVGGLAVYLIEHGPVVHDGNTFGASETERMTVRHVTSTRFAGLSVLHARSISTDNATASDGFARMPTDREAASFVGLPEDDGVLSSYIDVVRGVLDGYSQSPDGNRAEEGDPDATRKIASGLNEVQDAMRDGLMTGKLFAFWPQAVKAW